VAQIRDVARGAVPHTAFEGGLSDALDDLAMAAGVRVTVSDVPVTELPIVVEVTVLLAARNAIELAAEPLTITVAIERRPVDAIASLVLTVDGWAGPLDQLVDDRIRTLGGTAEPGATNLSVHLPLGDE
jgi:hypothetical protein